MDDDWGTPMTQETSKWLFKLFSFGRTVAKLSEIEGETTTGRSSPRQDASIMFDMQKLNEELPSKLVSYPSRLAAAAKKVGSPKGWGLNVGTKCSLILGFNKWSGNRHFYSKSLREWIWMGLRGEPPLHHFKCLEINDIIKYKWI